MVDGSEGREVQLINRKSLRSLTSQLLGLLMSQEEEQVTMGLKVDVLSQYYLNVHGAPLNPCEYGFLSLSELLKSLPYLVEVSGKSLFVCLSNLSSLSALPHRGRTVTAFDLLPQLYHEESDEDNNRAGSTASGRSEEWVRLTRLYQFARNVRALLHTYHYNQIFLTEFQGVYKKFTGCSLEPHSYGYISTDELLSAIPQVGINLIRYFILYIINLTMFRSTVQRWSQCEIC